MWGPVYTKHMSAEPIKLPLLSQLPRALSLPDRHPHPPNPQPDSPPQHHTPTSLPSKNHSLPSSWSQARSVYISLPLNSFQVKILRMLGNTSNMVDIKFIDQMRMNALVLVPSGSACTTRNKNHYLLWQTYTTMICKYCTLAVCFILLDLYLNRQTASALSTTLLQCAEFCNTIYTIQFTKHYKLLYP